MGAFVERRIQSTHAAHWMGPLVHQFVVARYSLDEHVVDRSKLLAFNEAKAWCEDQFGLADGRRWTFHPALREITFRDKVDATAFKMRWV